MSAPSTRDALVKHSSRYLGGQALVMLSGFISFPLLTRLFTIEDYGLLTLLSTLILIGTALGKFGLSNSAVRFHSDSGDTREAYYTTHLIGVVIMGTATAALSFGVVAALQSGSPLTITLFMMAVVALIVALRSVQTVMFAFLQAEQRSSLYNLLAVAQKYGSLALSLLLMVTWFPGFKGFLVGLAVGESGILFIMLLALSRRERISLRYFSLSLFVRSVKYGLPLAWSELAYILFARIDLFLIGYFLGSYEVGLYSVAYNLGRIIQTLVVLPLSLAVMPIYLRKWQQEGAEETSRFLSMVANYLLIAILPMAVGLSFLAEDIIQVMASAKYLPAASLIPWIISGLFIYGLYYLAAAGFYVERRTAGITLVVGASLLVNLAINLILIPIYGIYGAAVATTISFVFLLGITLWRTRKILPIRFNWVLIGQALLATALMAVPLALLQLDNLILDMIVKISAGATIYIGVLTGLSSEVRGRVRDQFRLLFRLGNVAT